jgi:DNA mismatch endonuclease, patch repair protein
MAVTTQNVVAGEVSASVRARMSRQRRKDTAPEVALRQELHRKGLRFRIDHPLPGIPRRSADVVFTRVHLAVFVDGCFWHDCPEHGTRPKVRARWWEEKLQKNVARDRDTDARLLGAGWTVLRFWEHESPISSAAMVEEAYRKLASEIE